MGNACCSSRGQIKYGAESISDSSELGFISAFEQTLPLKKIDIDEFERRLKKLVDSSNKDTISEA